MKEILCLLHLWSDKGEWGKIVFAEISKSLNSS